MFKICSCFKANPDDGKKLRPIKKEGNVKSKGKTYSTINLFLTGDDESGRTKIIEELVALQDPFTYKDKVLKLAEIEGHIRDSIINILRAFRRCKPPVELEYPENHEGIDYLLNTANDSNFECSIQFFDQVQFVWADAGLQNFVNNSTTYKVPDSAKYFLDRVSKIRDPDYIPTTQDMINSRLFPSPIFKMSVTVEKEAVHLNVLEMDLLDDDQQELLQSFGQDANAIVFMTNCTSFHTITGIQGFPTRLRQSMDDYIAIRETKLFDNIPLILLLNKQDLLAKMIKSGFRLEDYFPDYTGYVLPTNGRHDTNRREDRQVTRAKYFIHDQFTKTNHNEHRHFTCDKEITIRFILRDYRALSSQIQRSKTEVHSENNHSQ